MNVIELYGNTSEKAHGFNRGIKATNNSEPLRIERGQFMRGSEIVAPEIDNREQIQLLQYYERVTTNREE